MTSKVSRILSYLRSLLSCRRHTEITSYRIDRTLTMREQFSFSFHRTYCFLCRRFERQIRLINTRAKALGEAEDLSEGELSPEKKKEILDAIRKIKK